jgi:hypothetical protein
MGARRPSARNTKTRAARRRGAGSRRSRPASGWARAAALALLLGGIVCEKPAALATELARIGVVSFSGSRQLVLLDGQSGEQLGTLAASDVAGELEVSGAGRLFLVGRSLVESIDLANPARRWPLRMGWRARMVRGLTSRGQARPCSRRSVSAPRAGRSGRCRCQGG